MSHDDYTPIHNGENAMQNLINTRVIVRSSPSGCWHGTLRSVDGQTVTLADARRLWRWWSAEGVSLSGVAAAGLDPAHLSECRIAAQVSTAVIFEVCEILAATERASASIDAAPVVRS